MDVISFSFSPHVSPPEQEAALQFVRNLNEIKAAGKISPKSQDAEISRMAMAYVADGHDVSAAASKIAAIPGVALATPAPQRTLVRPVTKSAGSAPMVGPAGRSTR